MITLVNLQINNHKTHLNQSIVKGPGNHHFYVLAEHKNRYDHETSITGAQNDMIPKLPSH